VQPIVEEPPNGHTVQPRVNSVSTTIPCSCWHRCRARSNRTSLRRPSPRAQSVANTAAHANRRQATLSGTHARTVRKGLLESSCLRAQSKGMVGVWALSSVRVRGGRRVQHSSGTVAGTISTSSPSASKTVGAKLRLSIIATITTLLATAEPNCSTSEPLPPRPHWSLLRATPHAVEAATGCHRLLLAAGGLFSFTDVQAGSGSAPGS
jgi:hypothetical protein